MGSRGASSRRGGSSAKVDTAAADQKGMTAIERDLAVKKTALEQIKGKDWGITVKVNHGLDLYDDEYGNLKFYLSRKGSSNEYLGRWNPDTVSGGPLKFANVSESVFKFCQIHGVEQKIKNILS